MNTTSRQVGGTLGIAVLGAFFLQQFSGNIASQLAQRGVPGPIGAAIASKIGSFGAQASQVPLPGRLPLPPAALHQAINEAFVDALHGSFLIAGIALFAAALLVAFLLKQKQPATKMSVEAVGLRKATGSLAMQGVVEEEVTR